MTNDGTVSDLFWPSPDIIEQADFYSSNIPTASVAIPGDLIRRRGKG